MRSNLATLETETNGNRLDAGQSRVARLVFFRPKFEDLVFYNLGGFGLVLVFLVNLFSKFGFFWSFFVKSGVFGYFLRPKNGDVVFKNAKFGKWFPRIRRNLATLRLPDFVHVTSLFEFCPSFLSLHQENCILLELLSATMCDKKANQSFIS